MDQAGSGQAIPARGRALILEVIQVTAYFHLPFQVSRALESAEVGSWTVLTPGMQRKREMEVSPSVQELRITF